MTAADPRFRYRLRFGKEGAMRWTGHLDLQKNFERMLRRAALPLWHTKGYHPRPRMVFASALPLGQSSRVELCDLWLREAMDANELLTRLGAVAHPDLPILDVQPVEGAETTLTVLLHAARYRAEPLDEEQLGAPSADTERLSASVAALLAADALPRERRGKRYDLRPLIEGLEVAEDGRALIMQLTAREGRNGRAEEVLLALGLDPADWRVERTALLLQQPPTAAP